MIAFEKFTLENGLKVLVHKDESTPITAVNILYNVGARDEHPDKTGFAHLFEHLMFGGSKNIPVFDEPLERVGGENNAFTNNDITNYYLTIPQQNLETAFWLESDRMNELAFSEKSLEVQRNVVVEEFKQRYLNQPYGDVWLLLRPLAYKKHPYQWSTIGKEISHIENAVMEDVKSFFYRFYRPNNAIMVIAGNVEVEQIKEMSKKWFGTIPAGEQLQRNIPAEPLQTEERMLTVERNVPYDAIYKTYHICKRTEKDYYTFDLISDILSNGKSSRFNNELVKKQKLFSEVNAYLSGDIDNGLFIISGKLNNDITMEVAEQAIDNEIDKLKNNFVEVDELQKVKNKAESLMIFSQMKTNDKAMNLAYFELLGDANMINTEIENYRNVTQENIKSLVTKTFIKSNCSKLYYLAKK
ncbi:MAG: insulinase family protein [Bacteroidetes bacterium]|nr:insulinase family protein [Bacteroidota bacterium]